MNTMEMTTQPAAPTAPASNGPSRRDEDIALDLLKFVAGSTNILRTTSTSTGFTAASSAKPEDQVTLLLDMYTRCLQTIQGKAGR